jgi:hypothetical protein
MGERTGSTAARRPIRLAIGAVALALAVSALLFAVHPGPGDERSAAAASEAHRRFDALCRGAGDERTSAVVRFDGDDGLAWLTPPLRLAGAALSDRYREDDAYDRGCAFEDCIARLLRVSFGASSNPAEAAHHAVGFAYVEVLDPRDLELYRYRAGIGVARWRDAREIEQLLRATGEEPGPAVYDFVLQRDAIDGYSARYGIRWMETTTPHDRSLGIAGSALDVVDLETGALIGRRTGYILASRTGEARVTCPSPGSATAPGSADRDFLLTLLR